MKKFTDIEKAYLAGMIDADGSITIVQHKHSHMREELQLRPSVYITNTDKKLLTYLEKLTDGKVYKKGLETENHKQGFVIKIDKTKEIIELLIQIKDLLIVKKERANLVIDFILGHVKIRYCGKSGGVSYTKEQLKIADKVKKINSGKNGLKGL